jgi:hypothetical protein
VLNAQALGTVEQAVYKASLGINAYEKSRCEMGICWHGRRWRLHSATD